MKMLFFCLGKCDTRTIHFVLSETPRPDSYYVELVIQCEDCHEVRKMLVYDETLAKWKQEDKEL